MTSEEIQALRDKLNQIERIESVIKSMQNNIKSHERVFSGKEISIQIRLINLIPFIYQEKRKMKFLKY